MVAWLHGLHGYIIIKFIHADFGNATFVLNSWKRIITAIVKNIELFY
jgi:hypothetical protein